MNRIQKRIGIAILAPLAIALFIWIGGELVMQLWNWLAPTLLMAVTLKVYDVPLVSPSPDVESSQRQVYSPDARLTAM